ncbi:hypothetical protein [Streptomyces aureus]|uniref:hypothetical protein n=1 Tax=Streptomyces aureus TaxID=193461 RepID=UPI00369EA68D
MAIEPPEDSQTVDSALATQGPAAELPGSEYAYVALFNVGDTDHVVLGTTTKQVAPNELLPASSLVAHPASKKALGRIVEKLGLTVLAGPDWLLVHDLD